MTIATFHLLLQALTVLATIAAAYLITMFNDPLLQPLLMQPLTFPTDSTSTEGASPKRARTLWQTKSRRFLLGKGRRGRFSTRWQERWVSMMVGIGRGSGGDDNSCLFFLFFPFFSISLDEFGPLTE